MSVIIPTYREAENLPHLVPEITEALAGASLAGEIVVVDDDSNDGTEEACAELARTHPLRLIVRRDERGLSTAVIHGFRKATGDVLVCMDGDGSHPPSALPDMVTAVRDGAEFVIGSRYVSGGSTEDDWGAFRWLNSKVATALSRPLTSARDPMAGYFALSRATFEQAAPLDPIGYKIGLELIVKCGCRNVHEVPIRFRNRRFGESKLSLKEMLNYVRHVGRLVGWKRARKRGAGGRRDG